MNDGLQHIRSIVGPQEQSEIEDSEIKNALWNVYFDVEHALQGLLGSSHFVSITSSSHSFRRDTRTKANGR
jgi:hypothetical protein